LAIKKIQPALGKLLLASTSLLKLTHASLTKLHLASTPLELTHGKLTKLSLCSSTAKLPQSSLLQATTKLRLGNLCRLRLWDALRHQTANVIIHRHPAATKGFRLGQGPRKVWVGRKESLRSPSA
jgi:hypothetical protein